MAWIETTAPAGAEGKLKDEYDAAMRRAGKIWNIVRVQSLNPESLAASMGLYSAVMKRPSPLPRSVREMLAVAVSRANDCHY